MFGFYLHVVDKSETDESESHRLGNAFLSPPQIQVDFHLATPHSQVSSQSQEGDFRSGILLDRNYQVRYFHTAIHHLNNYQMEFWCLKYSVRHELSLLYNT